MDTRWAAALVAAATLAGCSDGTDPDDPEVVTSVALGTSHSCALTDRGRTFCWGSNSFGELGGGLSDQTPHTSPAAVSTSLRFRALGAGQYHSCGLTEGGAVYCWGSLTPLGTGAQPVNTAAAPVQVAGGLSFTEIHAGTTGTCAIASTSAAYCWGFNSAGQLGTGVWGEGGKGGPAPAGAMVLAPAAVLGGLRFTRLSLEAEHTCGLTSSGAAYCWGNNGSGRLGNAGAAAPSTEFGYGVPAPVAGNLAFTQITVGAAHSCALTSAGAAYCWGANNTGQLGTGAPGSSMAAPQPVAGGLRFEKIEAGAAHTCAITTAGALSCWGSNLLGALGSGTSVSESGAPVAVGGALRFESLSARAYSTCAVSVEPRVYCWGQNTVGQLGDGTTSSRGVPTPITIPL